jgi:hypothetical protein
MNAPVPGTTLYPAADLVHDLQPQDPKPRQEELDLGATAQPQTAVEERPDPSAIVRAAAEELITLAEDLYDQAEQLDAECDQGQVQALAAFIGRVKAKVRMGIEKAHQIDLHVAHRKMREVYGPAPKRGRRKKPR